MKSVTSYLLGRAGSNISYSYSLKGHVKPASVEYKQMFPVILLYTV
jgi:hypothetical protein